MDLRALLLLVGLVGVRADDASAWDVTPPDAFCVLHGAHLCVGDYHTHVNQDETTFSAVALGRSTFAAPTCGTRVPLPPLDPPETRSRAPADSATSTETATSTWSSGGTKARRARSRCSRT